MELPWLCEYNGVINVLYYQNYTVKPHYSNNCLLAWNERAKPWQGERVLQISTDKNGRMGAKIKTQKKSLGLQTKPQKIPGPKFNPKKSQFPNHKNFQRNYAARIHRNYHKSSDYLEYPQKSLLKSSYPKKYLPKFSYLKKSRNWKFQTPKNPLIIPVVWSFLSIWSPPPPPRGAK